MVVISKDLENTIKNKFVVPYLTILKDNQYLVITDEDDDKDFEVHLSSAVGGFKVIENPDDSFKTLLHVAQSEPENIALIVNERVEDSIDYIFTGLKIRE